MVKETARESWSGILADPKHGPLPAFLVVLTVVTGLVDAVSILSLGRVFVANMTGNVVFIGFALAGAPGFSLTASLFALGGFLVGAFFGGSLIGEVKASRSGLLLISLVTELVLFAASAVVAQVAATPYSHGIRDGLAATLAIAMGVQNAMVRRLAVPDLTTTVLTTTLTGLASELRARNRAVTMRRLLAVIAMLGGAAAGAALVVQVRPSVPLWTGAGLVAAVTVFATITRRRPNSWDTGGSSR